jgi:Ser/Thr protein kinase RdoA (MazF antagonist)
VLDARALLHRVANQYEIPRPSACRFHSRGDSDIYRVHADGATCYLKVYRPPHTVALAEAEGRLVADLDREGVPVAQAVPRRDVRVAIELTASEGPRPAMLFEAAPFGRVDATDHTDCRAPGRAVARLHDALDRVGASGIPAELDRTWRPDVTLPSAAPLMAENDPCSARSVLSAGQ